MRQLHRPAMRSLTSDAQGATLPEFAVVLPVFLLLMFGIFDIGQGIYVQSVLQGAVQNAGRDAGLESGASQKDAIDQRVRDQLQPLIQNATYTIERANYQTFSDVGRPEDFTDTNGNEKYDPDECFVDENGNNTWDSDVGKGGLGSANDVVLYTVSVTYDRLFPLWKLIDGSPHNTVSAATTMRNQPFGSQTTRVKKQICPAP